MDNPPRIPAQPRDFEQEGTYPKSAQFEQRKHTSHKTKVTITTSATSGIPDQIIYPLHNDPSIRPNEQQGSVASENGTQTSESGCSAQTQKTGTTTTTANRALIKDANEYYMKGQYSRAMKAFKSVLKSKMFLWSEDDDPLLANILAIIGSIHLRQDRYQSAIESLEEAIRIMRQLKIKSERNNNRKTFKSYARLVAVLNDLGTAKFLQGNHIDSLQCYWEATRIAKEDGEESQKKELVISLYNIGRISVLQKDYSMALKTLAESLHLEKTLRGEKSVEAFDTLNLIGFVHYSTGYFDRAISIFTNALSIVTANFGSVHEKVAISLMNVGMVLEKEDNYEESLRCFSTAQLVCKKLGLDKTNIIMRTAARGVDDIRRQLLLVEDAKLASKNNAIGIIPRDTIEPPLPQDKVISKSINPTRLAKHKYFTNRSEEENVMETYAAYKRKINSKRLLLEYREDPNWEFDNSSIVEEKRDN